MADLLLIIMAHIALTGGDGVSKAFEKMKTNTTNSAIKNVIDNWYRNNMTSQTDKIEDIPWCNDRSMQTTTNGWNENGNLNEPLFYGGNGRVGGIYNSISPTYIPSLNCQDKNDSFSVNEKNGNGALQYPVALLTIDEIRMAGGDTNSSYLNTSQFWWSLSPESFGLTGGYAFEFGLDAISLGGNSVYNPGGVRPAISLKHSMVVKDGDGTYTNPMIVE